MNGPLHFYLADLVGNARQLTIATDNARIPIDGSDQQQQLFNPFADDASAYSSYTRYSNTTSSTMDSSMSGSSNSSSRWDSEVLPSGPALKSKEQRPRMPPRRTDSDMGDAPSPEMPTRRPASPMEEHLNTKGDCCLSFPSSSSSSFNNKPLTLSSVASQGMLRMPKRSESITKPEKRRKRPQQTSKGHSNPAKSSSKQATTTAASKGWRRESSRSPRDSRRTRTSQKSKEARNVSTILGEAMRELGLTEDELAACEDPTLPLQYLTEPKEATAQ